MYAKKNFSPLISKRVYAPFIEFLCKISKLFTFLEYANNREGL